VEIKDSDNNDNDNGHYFKSLMYQRPTLKREWDEREQ